MSQFILNDDRPLKSLSDFEAGYIGAMDWEAGKTEWKQWQALGWAR